MFRRSSSSASPDAESTPESASGTAGATGPDGLRTEGSSGKGRPTPSRREAEAAAKERAKAARDPKARRQADRKARQTTAQRTRAAMKSGDEKYLPARDKGPERRFIRDFVDSRLSFIELLLPILLVTMVLAYTGNPTAERWSNTIMMTALLMIVIDLVLMRIRLRRQLAERFPDSSHKGTTGYAIMRAMQMKFLRLPKAQVKIGETLPDRYR